MQNIQLWPVMVYDFQWDYHDKYKERLKEICREQELKNNKSNIAPNAKIGLYESDFDFFKIDDPVVEIFSHWAKDCFFKAASEANKIYWPKGINIEIEIHESWCHITRDGGYHDMHTHPMSSWSAIYYLDCGDMNHETKNGLNRFYCPYQPGYTDAGTAWTSANSSVDVNADDGMLVIFPSWLSHSALTYRGLKDRYVLAFNCKINKADLKLVDLAI